MQSRLYGTVFVILSKITGPRTVSNEGRYQLVFDNKKLLLMNNY